MMLAFCCCAVATTYLGYCYKSKNHWPVLSVLTVGMMFFFRVELSVPMGMMKISIEKMVLVALMLYGGVLLFAIERYREVLTESLKRFSVYLFWIPVVIILSSLLYNWSRFGELSTFYLRGNIQYLWIIPFLPLIQKINPKRFSTELSFTFWSGLFLTFYSSSVYYLIFGRGLGRDLANGVRASIIDKLGIFVTNTLVPSGKVNKVLFVIDSLGSLVLALSLSGVISVLWVWLLKKSSLKKMLMCFLLYTVIFWSLMVNQYFSLIMCFLVSLLTSILFVLFLDSSFRKGKALSFLILNLVLFASLTFFNPLASGYENNMFLSRLRVVWLFESNEECENSMGNCDHRYVKRTFSEGNRISLIVSAIRHHGKNLFKGVGYPSMNEGFQHDSSKGSKLFTGHSYLVDMIISFGLFFGIAQSWCFILPLFFVVLSFLRNRSGSTFEELSFYNLFFTFFLISFLSAALGVYGYGPIEKTFQLISLVIFLSIEKKLFKNSIDIVIGKRIVKWVSRR